MKVLKPKYVLEIEWITDESHSSIAATDYIQHPNIINKHNRIHDEKLRILNDAAMSLVSMLEARQFILTRPPKQSSRSYSFYTYFYPVTKTGETLNQVEIVFRISDHKHPNSKQVETADPISVVRIRSFLIGDDEFKDVISFTVKLGEILDTLQDGDYSVLL